MASYISRISNALALSQPLALDDPSSPPLLIYAKSGDVKKVSKLLSTSAAVDELLEERDKWEQTALHKASRRGKFDVVRFLLHHGADVHSTDFIGYTPAQFAAHYRHYEILSELIMAGSDIEYDNDHTRSIMRYCNRDPNVSMVVDFALPRRKERQAKLRDLIVASAEDTARSRFPEDLALLIVGFVPSLPTFWDAPLGQAEPGALGAAGDELPFKHFVDSQRENLSHLVQQSRGHLSKLQGWLHEKQRMLESQLQQQFSVSHNGRTENGAAAHVHARHSRDEVQQQQFVPAAAQSPPPNRVRQHFVPAAATAAAQRPRRSPVRHEVHLVEHIDPDLSDTGPAGSFMVEVALPAASTSA